MAVPLPHAGPEPRRLASSGGATDTPVKGSQMKRLVITLVLAGALLVVLAAPAGASTAVWQPRTVATFAAGDYGAFLEGLAADSHGNLFGSLTTWGYYDETTADSNVGEVWRVAPNGHMKRMATKDLSPNGMLMGVAVDSRDRVYVATYDVGDPQTLGCGVYRVDPGGSMVRVISIPAGSWPNGLAFHDGRAYITDSALGAVWRAPHRGRRRLAGRPLVPGCAPAARRSDVRPDQDGHRCQRRSLPRRPHVRERGRLPAASYRCPILAGGSAGAPRVFCEQPKLATADGIAFDAKGRLWVATNSGATGGSKSGALYRLSSSGTLTQIADDPGWLNYPTMPVFGTTKATVHTLFVANGAYFSYEDGSSPDIQALHVSVAGLPLK